MIEILPALAEAEEELKEMESFRPAIPEGVKIPELPLPERSRPRARPMVREMLPPELEPPVALIYI